MILSSRASRGCWTPTPTALSKILQRLREEGYDGGVTILRDYVRRIRPPKRPVYLKLHFAPGEFEAVQALLKTRSPALTAPRIVSGPTLLTGFCFCAACGRAMTLRTGKSGQYRYYTCSTKARQGETGCKGRTVPKDKLDTLVANHIEQRLLQPKRLERILSTVLDRREERTERRAAHIAQLRKRAAEAEAKLKRLYDAIENGVADLADPMRRIASSN